VIQKQLSKRLELSALSWLEIALLLLDADRVQTIMVMPRDGNPKVPGRRQADSRAVGSYESRNQCSGCNPIAVHHSLPRFWKS
jgi:hypothetical protein